MKKWSLLIFTGFSCVAVWGLVLWSVFNFSNQYVKTPQKSSNEQLIISSTEPLNRAEEVTLTKVEAKSIRARGIQKEDIKLIAPTGVISIDDLLTIVSVKDQH